MPSRSLGVLVAVAAVVVAGAFTFPQALEPGRSEESGITLNALVDRGDQAGANDWYSGQPGAGAKTRGATIIVTGGPRKGLELISRPLPVFPHSRYELDVRMSVARKPAVIGIGDTDLHTYIASLPVEAGTARTLHFVFGTQSQRRITIAFLSKPGAVLTISKPRLLRR